MAQVEAIRRALRVQPFRPFSLKLVDGTDYTVKHHDWLSIPPVRRPREVTFYAVSEDNGDNYETHWIDLALILEVIVPPSPATAQAELTGDSNAE